MTARAQKSVGRQSDHSLVSTVADDIARKFLPGADILMNNRSTDAYGGAVVRAPRSEDGVAASVNGRAVRVTVKVHLGTVPDYDASGVAYKVGDGTGLNYRTVDRAAKGCGEPAEGLNDRIRCCTASIYPETGARPHGNPGGKSTTFDFENVAGAKGQSS